MEFRRFVLQRDEDETGVSGTGVVAEGVEYSNGVIALHWSSRSSVVFHHRGMESVEHVHGHNGKTRIVWLDETDDFWSGLIPDVEMALHDLAPPSLVTDVAREIVDVIRRRRDLSNTSIGGNRLTWAELAAHNEERARRAEVWARIVSDLDRCQHGRHEGDDCSSCGGPSTGNRFIETKTGRIGTTLSGQPIVFPRNPRERLKPEAWDAEIRT